MAEQTDQNQGNQGGEGGAGAGAGGGGTPAPTPTPAAPPAGFKLTLTEEQRQRLLAGGTLELSDEQYTGGVRQELASLRQRSAAAEKKLAEKATAQEEAERKALEEQKKFQELYEKERVGAETLRARRREDLVRSEFLLAAVKAGVVDPRGAFAIAREAPGFSGIQVDEEGAVTGVAELVESLVKEKPYLVPQTQKPQQVGSPSNPPKAGSQEPAPTTIGEAGDRLSNWAKTQA